jgi:hypothetical protein
MHEDRLREVFELPEHPAKLALGQRGLAMIPNRNVADLEACLPVGLQQSSRKGSLIPSAALRLGFPHRLKTPATLDPVGSPLHRRRLRSPRPDGKEGNSKGRLPRSLKSPSKVL